MSSLSHPGLTDKSLLFSVHSTPIWTDGLCSDHTAIPSSCHTVSLLKTDTQGCCTGRLGGNGCLDVPAGATWGLEGRLTCKNRLS